MSYFKPRDEIESRPQAYSSPSTASYNSSAFPKPTTAYHYGRPRLPTFSANVAFTASAPPAVTSRSTSGFAAYANSTYQSTRDSSQDSTSTYEARRRRNDYDDDYSQTRTYNSKGASGRSYGQDEDAYTKATFQVEEKYTNGDSEDLFKNTRNSGINFSKYNDIPVSIEGRNAPKPITSFSTAKLNSVLLENIEKSGYKAPTPVQQYSLPIVSDGRDLMASAQTGSGKTAAFLLPVIDKLISEKTCARPARSSTPEILVLSPTRELAVQTQAEAQKFCFNTGLRSVVCYGGAPVGYQIRDLQQGCNVLVGTPGRLLDLVERRLLSFSRIKYLILDEADRMLDMGFEKDIRKIVEQQDMPRTRQTLMFSATFPKEIRQLAMDFLGDYLFLKVGRVGSTTESITQHVKYILSTEKQAEVVKDIKATPGRTVVFAETKRDTDTLARYLFNQGFAATGIHGDRQQREREAALRSFKAGKIQVLVATDVAARGLDIDDVTHVINYDLPANIDSYIHRIGRTGRAGNVGKATCYFTDEDKGISKAMVKVLSEAKQKIPDWLQKMSAEVRKGGGGAMRRSGGRGRFNPYGRGNRF